MHFPITVNHLCKDDQCLFIIHIISSLQPHFLYLLAGNRADRTEKCEQDQTKHAGRQKKAECESQRDRLAEGLMRKGSEDKGPTGAHMARP